MLTMLCRNEFHVLVLLIAAVAFFLTVSQRQAVAQTAEAPPAVSNARPVIASGSLEASDELKVNESESEENEEFIETDRNSFTFSRRTAPTNRFIFESAYTNISIGRECTKHSFPESVLRYGLNDRIELRLGDPMESDVDRRVAEAWRPQKRPT